jgi:hypothetical protein
MRFAAADAPDTPTTGGHDAFTADESERVRERQAG